MDLKKRLSALDNIYNIYDEFTAGLDLACRKACAHCCTTHVTLTTLEGYKISTHLSLALKADLLNLIRTGRDEHRFRPGMTTNQLADLCASGSEPPIESEAVPGRACPLLAGRLCSIYELRPLGCRCLVSRFNCGEKGYAEIDDFTLSMNTVFLQTIEHLDVRGCTGNLTDVLEVLLSDDRRAAYDKGSLDCQNMGLICNHPLTALMIPPEHRTRMEAILKQLRKLKF